MKGNPVRPALLTRAEMNYVLDQSTDNPNLTKVMRHHILTKLRAFLNVELPALQKAANEWPNLLATLRTSATVNTGLNLVNTGVNDQEMGTRGLEPPISGSPQLQNYIILASADPKP